MKKTGQITFKTTVDIFTELEKRAGVDGSPSLVARDLMEKALALDGGVTAGINAISEEILLARAVWLLISTLSEKLTSEESAVIVRIAFLDGRNAPEFKS
jgi:hypothetical protein